MSSPAGPLSNRHAMTVLALQGVCFERSGRMILDGIDWDVRTGERWAVLGPNGSGKSTIVRIASLYLHPSAGEVHVLGERLGSVDVRHHRRRIGLAAASLADQLRPELTGEDIVVCALNAALEPWWHAYTDADRAAARAQLDRLGCGYLAKQPFGICSSGERQRILLARTLLTDPGLLLLDEPTAALDLGGREQLVSTLDRLALDPSSPPVVLVTHHVEEIPSGFTHALLLRQGKVNHAGPIVDVLTAENLSECFGLAIHLGREGGRWQAWSAAIS